MASSSQELKREIRFERVIGSVRGSAAGPTLIVIGGIHGNEPGGILAAERVLEVLSKDRVRGELVVLSGNLAALRLSRRYLVKDLNRQWSDARVRALKRGAEKLDAEDREQLELASAIEDAIARARGEVYVLDLHTTSASGVPFVLFGDTLRQRRFGFSFPLPVVLGLEEQIDGVLGSWATERGCITVAIEGGQHDDPKSTDSLEACIWVALTSAGAIARGPEHDAAYRRLDAQRGTLPRVMEVTERHAIRPEDEFRMAPGFANLDRASKGQLLARDRTGEIRADRDVLVILPLYQGLGSDGFFWGREVSAPRLAVEERLRGLSLDRLLPLLPGVRRDPAIPSRLRAEGIARLYPRDLFFALGYRRIRAAEGVLTIARPRE